MSQVELKPCPFCGGEARLSTVGRSWYRVTADHHDSCILEEHESDCPQTDDQLALLFRDWNLRTNSEVDQLKAENDRLRNVANELRRFAACEHLHHEKADQHELDEPCKVIVRIDAAMSKEP